MKSRKDMKGERGVPRKIFMLFMSFMVKS